MLRRKQQRIALLATLLVLLGGATALVLAALRDNVVFFVAPSDVAAGTFAPGQRVRLGGLVTEGSVQRDGDTIHFSVTDGPAAVPVVYRGILPDLFREGQGLVANGALDAEGVFHADEVLAKHDEAYMPREVAEALKKTGHWQPEGADR